ncbi:hypothetical protein GCM10020295_04090 [Streptomyces cinereospinus]
MDGRAPVDAVLLIHGWGGSAASDWHDNGWGGLLAGHGRAALAVDLPGHGRLPQSHDPADYADLAAGVLAELPDGGPLDAVGFSLGAKVLLELAARHPDRFGRLVLGGLGGNAFAPERLGRELADALEAGPRAGTPAAVSDLAAYGIGNGNDRLALAACLRRTANPVLTPRPASPRPGPGAPGRRGARPGGASGAAPGRRAARRAGAHPPRGRPPGPARVRRVPAARPRIPGRRPPTSMTR